MDFLWNRDVVIAGQVKEISNGIYFTISEILLTTSIYNPEHTELITLMSQH